MDGEKLKKRIESVYGREIKYSRDCDPLATEISQNTGGTVSASTVKRLLGFVKTSSKPSQYTLDTIAIYLGFPDWNKFVASEFTLLDLGKNNRENTEKENEELLVIPKKAWKKNVITTSIISLVTIFFMVFAWYCFSDASSSFSELAHLPELRNAGRAISYDKSIFYIGGNDAVYPRNNTWKYDFDNKKWLELSPLPTARSEFAAAIVKNTIYCFGGWLGNEKGETDVVEAYNIKTNKWDALPNLPVKITSANAVSIDSDVFVLGGTTGKTQTHLIRYDTKNQKYEELPPPKRERIYCAMVVANGLIYIIGGNSFADGEYKWLNNVSVYNPKNRLWTELEPLPMQITRSCATFNNNKIHIAGGTDGFGNDNESIRDNHFVYDIVKNEWREEDPLPYKISAHQLITHKGKLFLLGGTTKFPNPVNKFIALN